MNCEKVREQIPELLAARLDQASRESVVEHLESCAGCRSEVAELNTVWRGMENLNDPADASPDPGAKARFLEGVEQIELLLREENVTHRGRFHVIEDVTSVLISPTWADFMFFVVLVLVLVVRPQGLYGVRLRESV